MRRQHFAVILFDEIEKADEGVFDLLLSVFDEGRLTDRFGRTTYFQSAVIIMTSNLGAIASETPGFGAGEIASSTYHRAAQTFFRPEFYNRIDAVLNFSALDNENVRRIAIKELNALNSREGMLKRSIRLVWTDPVVDHVAQAGFDSRLGARPLQRVVEREIVTPLALHLNRHPQLRDTQITIDFEEDRVIVVASNLCVKRSFNAEAAEIRRPQRYADRRDTQTAEIRRPQRYAEDRREISPALQHLFTDVKSFSQDFGPDLRAVVAVGEYD